MACSLECAFAPDANSFVAFCFLGQCPRLRWLLITSCLLSSRDRSKCPSRVQWRGYQRSFPGIRHLLKPRAIHAYNNVSIQIAEYGSDSPSSLPSPADMCIIRSLLSLSKWGEQRRKGWSPLDMIPVVHRAFQPALIAPYALVQIDVGGHIWTSNLYFRPPELHTRTDSCAFGQLVLCCLLQSRIEF